MDLGHWQLAEGVSPKEAFGFIYKITNNAINRSYIGKKQCVSRIKRKPLKGKTRNRIDKKESDWKSYTGSSNELNEDIKKYGKENFTFIILEWGDSKFELGYKEIKLQILEDALLKESYYNGIINVRLSKPKNYGKNIS
jgi:hypothetical protein